jgi:ADP-heptose:LPS heptosyltransferase
MPRVIKQKPKPRSFSLREFYSKRNEILIIRETGGLGDILMHRMIFEDIKLLNPDIETHFACPTKYHEAVEDHPFIDKVLDSRKTDTGNYVNFYTTTSACNRHEMMMAPFSKKHRADIWANHCGVELTRHNLHMRLDPKYEEQACERLPKNKPTVALCPISAMIAKNLTDKQQAVVVNFLHTKGYHVIGLHDKPIPELEDLDVEVWSGMSIREWMGALDAVDYVVAVDSAAFHYAGGRKKPLVGIFSFADGKVYGRYSDFILVQKHRDNGDWDCGPCYNWPNCPKSKRVPKPCLTEITPEMLKEGISAMFERWPFGEKPVQIHT